MLNTKFSQEDIYKFAKYRDNQQNNKLKMRFVALLLLSQNIDIGIVAKIIGYSEQSIENFVSQYWSEAIDSLNSFKYKPKEPYLTQEQVKQVCNWVRNENPGKIKIVQKFQIV